jgi:hypothetical protein
MTYTETYRLLNQPTGAADSLDVVPFRNLAFSEVESSFDGGKSITAYRAPGEHPMHPAKIVVQRRGINNYRTPSGLYISKGIEWTANLATHLQVLNSLTGETLSGVEPFIGFRAEGNLIVDHAGLLSIMTSMPSVFYSTVTAGVPDDSVAMRIAMGDTSGILG